MQVMKNINAACFDGVDVSLSYGRSFKNIAIGYAT
jgi:hypothetical protein